MRVHEEFCLDPYPFLGVQTLILRTSKIYLFHSLESNCLIFTFVYLFVFYFLVFRLFSEPIFGNNTSVNSERINPGKSDLVFEKNVSPAKR